MRSGTRRMGNPNSERINRLLLKIKRLREDLAKGGYDREEREAINDDISDLLGQVQDLGGSVDYKEFLAQTRKADAYSDLSTTRPVKYNLPHERRWSEHLQNEQPEPDASVFTGKVSNELKELASYWKDGYAQARLTKLPSMMGDGQSNLSLEQWAIMFQNEMGLSYEEMEDLWRYLVSIRWATSTAFRSWKTLLQRNEFYPTRTPAVAKEASLRRTASWFIYIPEEGDWPINYSGDSKEKALEAYLSWAGRTRLPRGARIWNDREGDSPGFFRFEKGRRRSSSRDILETHSASATHRLALPKRTLRPTGKRPSHMGETSVKMANDLVRAFSRLKSFNEVRKVGGIWMQSNPYSDVQRSEVTTWADPRYFSISEVIGALEGLGYKVAQPEILRNREIYKAVKDEKHYIKFCIMQDAEIISFDCFAPKRAKPTTIPYYD